MSDPRQRIVVTAAVIARDNMFLVTQRPQGVHLEGYWEFPGGKCDAGEALESCLKREIAEELGAEIRIGERLLVCSHVYPTRVVELHFFGAELLGNPRPLLGQKMRWVARGELPSLQFPPADDELIALLTASEELPRR